MIFATHFFPCRDGGFYNHGEEKVCSKAVFTDLCSTQQIEAVFLFCNHKSRRPKMAGVHENISSCHRWIFATCELSSWSCDFRVLWCMPLAIALGFAQQWSLWTYKIYTKGVNRCFSHSCVCIILLGGNFLL